MVEDSGHWPRCPHDGEGCTFKCGKECRRIGVGHTLHARPGFPVAGTAPVRFPPAMEGATLSVYTEEDAVRARVWWGAEVGGEVRVVPGTEGMAIELAHKASEEELRAIDQWHRDVRSRFLKALELGDLAGSGE